MSVLVVMNGLPGSGKSTLARELYKQAPEHSIICSADDYFMMPDGEYKFERHMLSEAHTYCNKKVKLAMDKGYHIIIVDNTNVQPWQIVPYLKLAEENGYAVSFRSPNTHWRNNVKECFERGLHNVPLAAIRRMNGHYNGGHGKIIPRNTTLWTVDEVKEIREKFENVRN